MIGAVPDSRSHRGPHPQDAELFAVRHLERLRRATTDLCWLLSRGYNQTSALKLVGDRYALTKRQRQAVSRAACSDDARLRRMSKRVDGVELGELWIDGFNVLLTLEVALGRGPVFVTRDECLRDIASVHGTYRRVDETAPAAALLTDELLRLQVPRVRLLLDAPVSNSGRLAQVVRDEWQARGVVTDDWQVVLTRYPDDELVGSGQIVASADGDVLDRASAWLNLARTIVQRDVPEAFVVDLSR